MEIYCSILAIEKVCIVVNYSGRFQELIQSLDLKSRLDHFIAMEEKFTIKKRSGLQKE